MEVLKGEKIHVSIVDVVPWLGIVKSAMFAVSRVTVPGGIIVMEAGLTKFPGILGNAGTEHPSLVPCPAVLAILVGGLQFDWEKLGFPGKYGTEGVDIVIRRPVVPEKPEIF